jgi:predicted nucleotidyltransferase
MQDLDAFVKRIVQSLNAAEVDYFLTGALAASYYGTPRTTTDIDVMVRVSDTKHKVKLVAALRDAGLIVHERKIDVALKSGFRIVTLSDTESPFTTDIILSDAELKKKAGSILGLPTFYQTPEDLILAKLRMIKATILKKRIRKDEEDVKSILEFAEVDLETVRREAQKDSTRTILEALLSEPAD